MQDFRHFNLALVLRGASLRAPEIGTLPPKGMRRWRTLQPGRYRWNGSRTQYQKMIGVAAQLREHYGIPVAFKTVL